ncbi:hypothetical protein ES703_72735 [subsurface metagenome]
MRDRSVSVDLVHLPEVGAIDINNRADNARLTHRAELDQSVRV